MHAMGSQALEVKQMATDIPLCLLSALDPVSHNGLIVDIAFSQSTQKINSQAGPV